MPSPPTRAVSSASVPQVTNSLVRIEKTRPHQALLICFSSCCYREMRHVDFRRDWQVLFLSGLFQGRQIDAHYQCPTRLPIHKYRNGELERIGLTRLIKLGLPLPRFASRKRDIELRLTLVDIARSFFDKGHLLTTGRAQKRLANSSPGCFEFRLEELTGRIGLESLHGRITAPRGFPRGIVHLRDRALAVLLHHRLDNCRVCCPLGDHRFPLIEFSLDGWSHLEVSRAHHGGHAYKRHGHQELQPVDKSHRFSSSLACVPFHQKPHHTGCSVVVAMMSAIVPAPCWPMTMYLYCIGMCGGSLSGKVSALHYSADFPPPAPEAVRCMCACLRIKPYGVVLLRHSTWDGYCSKRTLYGLCVVSTTA